MKIITLCTLFFIFNLTFSQNWEQVGLGANSCVYKLYTDTTNNLLYASGNFKTLSIDTIKGIAKWNGIIWDSLGSGLNYPEVPAIAFYKNELYVGGGFTKAGGIPIQGIAKWNGINWDFVGTQDSLGSILDFHVYNNDLYVGGAFGYIDTTTSRAFAKWNGNAWYSVGSPTWTLVQINAILAYKGEIYAGGTFEFGDSITTNCIARWNGNSWSNVGNGIIGFSVSPQINAFSEYKGLLYLAGNFKQNDGNAGNYIMSWNGSSYSNVGGGVNGEIKDMVVFNNELYVVGNFSQAGGIPALGIAKWNGIKWCSLGSNINGLIYSIEVFNSVLYVGGSFTQIDSNNIYYIAKWLGGDYVDTCSQSYSVPEISDNTGVAIFPNPAHSQIKIISNNGEQLNHAEIYSLTGKMVLRKELNTANAEIDVSGLAEGLYLIKVLPANGIFYKKLIIQH